MQRKLPDVSTSQLVASGVATLVAAVGASYLGVYGTIIGAALMSVMSTAGSAVVKHYLDQGRSQIKDMTHMQAALNRRGAVERAASEARHADPTRTVVWPGGDPNATRLDLRLPGGDGGDGGGGDPNATRLDDPNATHLDRTPAETVADTLASAAGEDALREAVRRSAWENTVEWAKRHWVKLVVSSATVFVIVVGGITIYEATTGSPIGSAKGSGTSVGTFLGGGGSGGTDETPTPTPSERTTTTPSGTPHTGPSGGLAPTGTATAPTAPTDEPTGRPTGPTAPTSTAPPTTTTPDTPAPTQTQTSDGGDQNGADPNTRTSPR